MSLLLGSYAGLIVVVVVVVVVAVVVVVGGGGGGVFSVCVSYQASPFTALPKTIHFQV